MFFYEQNKEWQTSATQWVFSFRMRMTQLLHLSDVKVAVRRVVSDLDNQV